MGRWIGLAPFAFLLSSTIVWWAASNQAEYTTKAERNVLDAVLTERSQYAGQGDCLAPITRYGGPYAGYGFSNGHSDKSEIWLDEALSAAKGRDVHLFTERSEESSLVRYLPVPVRGADCSYPVVVNTPVFSNGMAFVGFSHRRFFGVYALKSGPQGWEIISKTNQATGPVI